MGTKPEGLNPLNDPPLGVLSEYPCENIILHDPLLDSIVFVSKSSSENGLISSIFKFF